MTALRFRSAKSVRIAVIISVASILIFICCASFIGFRYEGKKTKALLTTLTLIFIYHIFVADVLLMFLKAIYYTILRRLPYTGEPNPAFVGGANRKKFLQRRIAALKSQLELGPTFYKRNEAMTLKYRTIVYELILYGGYFILLLMLIVKTRDPLAYYNTRVIRDVLRNPKFGYSVISTIVTADDLYSFINGTLVQGFNDGTSYNDRPFDESGWMDLQIAKLLGVIRLRQIRHSSLTEASDFDTAAYGPGWARQIPSLPYMDKFWRIFKPWIHQSDIETGGVDRTGKLYNQPGGGYVALLGRNIANSQTVLNFLHKNKWIDGRTAVIIIEFTLYNVDADVFTLVTISAEQTAFNSFVLTDKVETLKLLVNIDNLALHVIPLFRIYFFVFMVVLVDLLLKMWYSPSARDFLSKPWNYLDMAIISLNFMAAIGVWHREKYVKQLLMQLETTKKNEFVAFYHAALIDEVCTVLIAFLVALATIRLWKLLQFARVFRMLTNTLHHAKTPLSSTTFFIAVFLGGIGLGSYIINGSNSPSFAEFFKSVTTLMSLSFGFAVHVTPAEMNYGGSVIGIIFYTILAVGVTIFLVNMFVTVLCLHFSQEKEEDNERLEKEDNYTFWQFLQKEIPSCIPMELVTDKDKPKLAKKDNVLRLRGGGSRIGKEKNNISNSGDHVRRIQLISDILDTQMELLRETVDSEQEEDDLEELSVPASETTVEGDKETHIEADKLDGTSKNLKVSRPMKRENIAEKHAESRAMTVRSL